MELTISDPGDMDEENNDIDNDESRDYIANGEDYVEDENNNTMNRTSGPTQLGDASDAVSTGRERPSITLENGPLGDRYVLSENVIEEDDNRSEENNNSRRSGDNNDNAAMTPSVLLPRGAEARAYAALAAAYKVAGDYDSAVDCLEEILSGQAGEIRLETLAEAYETIGTIYAHKSSIKEGLMYLDKAYGIRRHLVVQGHSSRSSFDKLRICIGTLRAEAKSKALMQQIAATGKCLGIAEAKTQLKNLLNFKIGGEGRLMSSASVLQEETKESNHTTSRTAAITMRSMSDAEATPLSIRGEGEGSNNVSANTSAVLATPSHQPINASAANTPGTLVL